MQTEAKQAHTAAAHIHCCGVQSSKIFASISNHKQE
jgi:hypothetical protein